MHQSLSGKTTHLNMFLILTTVCCYQQSSNFFNSSQLFKTRISAYFRKIYLTNKKCLFIEQSGLTQIDLLILAYLLFPVNSSHLLTSKYISPTSNKADRQHSISELERDNLPNMANSHNSSEQEVFMLTHLF